ncbi:MAG: hypothetical protein AAB793_01655, partial [Patescibacteria group bacterium]
MIEQLFGNNSRRKVAEFFLTRIHDSFSFDELKNYLGETLSPKTLKDEVGALVRLRLIEAYWHEITGENESDKKAGGKINDKAKKHNNKPEKEMRFQVNLSFPLLPELHSLVLKSIIFWEQKLVKKIKSLGNIGYLAFTGFFTDTNHTPTDILIVGRVNKKRLAQVMRRFQTELHLPVRYTLLSKNEYEY